MSKPEEVKKIITELLDHLDSQAEVAVEVDSEDPELLRINVSSPDPGILIGRHGETLDSLQLILGLIIYKKTGEWQKLLVDIEGYREEEAEKLRELASRTADRVRFFARPISLPPMSPFRRRIIHLALAEDKDVTTESIGEGRERRVVVKPI